MMEHKKRLLPPATVILLAWFATRSRIYPHLCSATHSSVSANNSSSTRRSSLWSSSSSSSCPCLDERLCRPIDGPPVRPGGEIFGFYGWWVHADTGVPPGLDMNWTHVTTIADAVNDTVMCLAHQHGARAVIMAPRCQWKDLSTQSARRVWIQNALYHVQSQFRDGLVFDYEGPQEEGSDEGRIYAALISETRDAFHAANPSLQITTCVAWTPDGAIDGRAYPYRALADASDLVYVMDYDTRSQIFDACLASANAPFPGMIQGMNRWLDLGVHASKIILGVPWYGYRYPCLPGTAPNAEYCPIKSVPFRGVNCSDAAGIELPYSDILKVLRSTAASVTGGLRWNENMGAPYFNAIEDGVVIQYWFDNPRSLRPKYAFARQHGLAGVGPWIFRNLDPVEASEDAAEMWSALDAFVLLDTSGRGDNEALET